MINLFTMGVQQMVLMAEQVQKWESELLRMHLRNLSMITGQAQVLAEKGEKQLMQGASEAGEMMRSSARTLRSATARQSAAFQSQSHSGAARSKGKPRRSRRD